MNNPPKSRLLHLILESEYRVLLESKPPGYIKTKLGIKKDAITDEDFQSIMDVAGNDRQLVVAMVKYFQETNDIGIIVGYTKKFVSLGLKNFNFAKHPTFKEFTEKVDEVDGEKSLKHSVASFSIENTTPDYQTKDGKIKVYDAKGRNECIKYGKGTKFCISQNDVNNMYNYYRGHQQSKYYFVFDLALQPTDNEYITVVDAHPDGKYEFTHADNKTEKTSEHYKYSLSEFIARKPSLKELAHVFKPVPLSSEEKEKHEYYKMLQGNPRMLSKVNVDVLMDYIDHGFYVPSKMVADMDNHTLALYINRGGAVPYKVIVEKPDNMKARYFKVMCQNNMIKDISDLKKISLMGTVYSYIADVENLYNITSFKLAVIAASCNDIKLFVNKVNKELMGKVLNEYLALNLTKEESQFMKRENAVYLCNLFSIRENIKNYPDISDFMMHNVLPGEIDVARTKYRGNLVKQVVDAYSSVANMDKETVVKDIIGSDIEEAATKIMDLVQKETISAFAKHSEEITNDKMMFALLSADFPYEYVETAISSILESNPYIFIKHPEFMRHLPAEASYFEHYIGRTNLGTHIFKNIIQKEVARRKGVAIDTRNITLPMEAIIHNLSANVPPMFHTLVALEIFTNSSTRAFAKSVLMSNRMKDPKVKTLLTKIFSKYEEMYGQN